jgi:hypothetical protein
MYHPGGYQSMSTDETLCEGVDDVMMIRLREMKYSDLLKHRNTPLRGC